MNDLDIAVKNILDENNDIEWKKEQDTINGANFSVKNPKYKTPKFFLGEAILRENCKTVQNIEIQSKIR